MRLGRPPRRAARERRWYDPTSRLRGGCLQYQALFVLVPSFLNPDGDRFFVLPTIQTPGLKTISFPPSAAPKGY